MRAHFRHGLLVVTMPVVGFAWKNAVITVHQLWGNSSIRCTGQPATYSNASSIIIICPCNMYCIRGSTHRLLITKDYAFLRNTSYNIMPSTYTHSLFWLAGVLKYPQGHLCMPSSSRNCECTCTMHSQLYLVHAINLYSLFRVIHSRVGVIYMYMYMSYMYMCIQLYLIYMYGQWNVHWALNSTQHSNRHV